MGKYFTDLYNVINFCWELLGKIWFWVSPIIVPLILPAWAIYLVRRNKKVFKISGVIYLALTLLCAIVWIYLYLRTGNYHFHPTALEAIKDIPDWLMPLTFFYIGVFFILEKRWWAKVIGLVSVLTGVIYFFAGVYIGTP